jgi:hypothetical protein
MSGFQTLGGSGKKRRTGSDVVALLAASARQLGNPNKAEGD